MTPAQFRQLALTFSGVVEASHMDHPDFRVAGRIFASLGWPNDEWAMVNLPPGEQTRLVRATPQVFKPCSGAWGRQGSTNIHLALATKAQVKPALAAAWENAMSRANKPRKSARKR